MPPGGPVPADGQRRARVVIPAEGLLLSSKLAELLEVRTGDLIEVEVLEGERAIRDVPVTALITEYGGTNAYMDIRGGAPPAARRGHAVGSLPGGGRAAAGRAVSHAEEHAARGRASR